MSLSPFFLFRDVISNPSVAAKLGLTILVPAYGFRVLTDRRADIGPEAVYAPTPDLLWLLAAVALFVAVVVWVALRRHRFVLAGPGDDIAPGWGRVLQYLRALLILVLILAVPGIALTGLLMVLSDMLFADALESGAGQAALSFVISCVLIWPMLRLGLVFPAVAVDRRMSFRASWRLTAPVAGALWGATAVLACVDILAGMLGTVSPTMGALGDAVVMMLNLAALTALYQLCAQGDSTGA